MKLNRDAFLLCIIFFLSRSINLIPFNNQNTYMLHGLGRHAATLKNDWLFNTIDPFPLFSFFTYIINYIPFHLGFYLFQFTLVFISFFSLMSLSDDKNQKKYFSLAILIIIFSSSFLDNIFPTRSLFGGVAGQSVFSLQYYQPSFFGLFIITSIALFCKSRYYLSIVCLSIASSFHASYLPYSAFLTIIYTLYIFMVEKDKSTAFKMSLISLILVLPYVMYIYGNFSSTSNELKLIKASILHDFRFPHHADIFIWFSKSEFLQCIIIVVGCVLSKGKLKLILTTSSILFFIIIILSFLFLPKEILIASPWRFAAIIIPISTFVIIDRALSEYKLSLKLIDFTYRKKNLLFLVAIILLLILNTRLITSQARALKKYDLIIESINNDLTLIPVSWASFRLNTKTPIVVDYKSHPYKDTELIEWKQRLDIVDDFYKAPSCEKLSNIIEKYNVRNFLFYKHVDCQFIDYKNTINDMYIYTTKSSEMVSLGAR